MNKIWMPQGRSILLQQKDEDMLKVVPSLITKIDNIYLAEEASILIYCDKDGNKHQMDVEEGDIIVTFYETSFPNKVVKVSSPEWVENINVYNQNEQKRKEAWAKTQKKLMESANAPETPEVCGDACINN